MKNVLIITYYWPPGGGSGVQRWLKFSRYLRDNGWNPVIFTPENPAYDVLDPGLEKQVDPDITVIKFPISEPLHWVQKLKGKKKSFNYQQQILEKKSHGLFDKLALWIRANLFIPDPRITWVRPAVSHITDQVLKQHNIDAIITTGPPFSLHLIGQRLKKSSNIPWFADFRDPWSDWDILRELNVKGRALQKHRELEKSVLETADEVMTSSQTTSNLLAEKVGRTYHSITNGADLEDFETYRDHTPDRFRLTYAGRLFPLRNPHFFWEVLAELISEHDDLATDLEVVLAGEISSEVQTGLAGFPEVISRTRILSYQSHEDIIRMYFESALLLLFLNQSDNSKLIIPGKLFEYLAAERRVLMTGPTESPSADILKKYNAGQAFEHEQREELKNWLLDQYALFKSDNFRNSVSTDEFDRKKLTRKLAGILNQMTS